MLAIAAGRSRPAEPSKPPNAAWNCNRGPFLRWLDPRHANRTHLGHDFERSPDFMGLRRGARVGWGGT